MRLHLTRDGRTIPSTPSPMSTCHPRQTAPGHSAGSAAEFRSPSGLGLAVRPKPPDTPVPAGLARVALLSRSPGFARSGRRRRTDSHRAAATVIKPSGTVREMAAIAFSVELRDWPRPHCLSAGRELLVVRNSPVSARRRATSRSFSFRFCEERRNRSKASSGVMSSRSIKIPLA
jgi:hypothetical protein